MRYTVEKTYFLPVYVQVEVEAGSIEEACKKVLGDDFCWNHGIQDYDGARPEFITGVWSGKPYESKEFSIPEKFREPGTS